MKIRQTHIGYHLDLDHQNHAPLRQAGVSAIGIDRWEAGRIWGKHADRGGSHRYVVLDGLVQFDAIDSPVGPGQLVTLPPRCPRRRTTGNAAVTAVFLEIPEVRNDRIRVLSSSTANWCQAILDQLYTDSLRATPTPGAEHLCRALLMYLTPPPEIDERSSRDRQRLNKLWQVVRDHPQHPWTTQGLAAELGCSGGHLHRLCVQHCDTTPMRMVTQLRIDLATHLLHTTDWNLPTIATAIGFGNAPAFSEAFHRIHQERPGAWRQRKRSEFNTARITGNAP